jgi:hypothetical protein
MSALPSTLTSYILCRLSDREKILRGKWLRLSQECMRSGRHAHDCAMDAFGAAAAQTLTHTGLHVSVRVYPHLPDLSSGCFPESTRGTTFDHHRCFSVRIFGDRRPTRIYQELERETQSALTEWGSSISGRRIARWDSAPQHRLTWSPSSDHSRDTTFGPHRWGNYAVGVSTV